MKRGWIGLGLLLVLLAGGIFSAWDMVSRQEPLEQTIALSADAALTGEWEEAENLAGQVYTQWERQWNLCAVFSDHAPMEEIDSLFSQLTVYGRQREALSWATVCSQLSQAFSAMAEAHIPSWWNLL